MWHPCFDGSDILAAKSINCCSDHFRSLTDDQAVVMLDMHNIVDAIHVSAGATLELVNITVSTYLFCAT